MDFSLTDRESHFRDRVRQFMEQEVRLRAAQYARALKSKAKAAGLWNLFMPPRNERSEADDGFVFTGARLTNLEYAVCAEEMGRIHWASEAFNCSASDSGNMELLYRYGTRAQKDRWLKPLMEGEIRSAFLMTEPDVARSDATNIRTSIRRDRDHYVSARSSVAIGTARRE